MAEMQTDFQKRRKGKVATQKSNAPRSYKEKFSLECCINVKWVLNLTHLVL